MLELFNYSKDVVVEALFPHKCVCGKWGKPICDECRASVRVDKTGLCPVCKRISDFGRTCGACRHKSSLTGVMILGPHEKVLKQAIWKLKYGFIKDTAEPLAILLAERFGQFIREKRFIITSAPISKPRKRWRGFNQAEALANYLTLRLHLEQVVLLTKSGETLPQVGLGRNERLRNIKGKIKYTGDKKPKNRKVLIVDDVYTTGATLEECAKVLRQNGYREVWAVVLSRD